MFLGRLIAADRLRELCLRKQAPSVTSWSPTARRPSGLPGEYPLLGVVPRLPRNLCSPAVAARESENARRFAWTEPSRSSPSLLEDLLARRRQRHLGVNLLERHRAADRLQHQHVFGASPNRQEPFVALPRVPLG